MAARSAVARPIPEQDVGGTNSKRSDELRIRASNLELSGADGLRTLAAKLSPALGEVWQATQPVGAINALALDIPLQATEKTRFNIARTDLARKQWQMLPGPSISAAPRRAAWKMAALWPR